VSSDRRRSRGSVALSRVGKSAAQVAKELGCSRPLVTYWLQGEREPSVRFREMMAERYGLAVGLWDEPLLLGATEAMSGPPKTRPAVIGALQRPISAPPVDGVAAIVAGGPFAMARELTLMAESQIRSLREDDDSTPLERAKVMASLATTIRTLAGITGDYDLSKRLTKLPLWRRLETELGAVLRKWPDAAQAVAELFERLDADSG